MSLKGDITITCNHKDCPASATHLIHTPQARSFSARRRDFPKGSSIRLVAQRAVRQSRKPRKG